MYEVCPVCNIETKYHNGRCVWCGWMKPATVPLKPARAARFNMAPFKRAYERCENMEEFLGRLLPTITTSDDEIIFEILADAHRRIGC